MWDLDQEYCMGKTVTDTVGLHLKNWGFYYYIAFIVVIFGLEYIL